MASEFPILIRPFADSDFKITIGIFWSFVIVWVIPFPGELSWLLGNIGPKYWPFADVFLILVSDLGLEDHTFIVIAKPRILMREASGLNTSAGKDLN